MAESDKSRRALDVMSPLLTATIPSPSDLDAIPQSFGGMLNEDSSMSHLMNSSASSAVVDVGALHAECRALRARVRSQQTELQAEQDSVCTLRKKLNAVERDRLDAIAKANEEVSRLDSEVTRLQAQLERGEANRQSLEYELAKAKKEIAESKRGATEREGLMHGINEGMKRKLDEVTAQVDQLCSELEQHKLKAKEEAKRLRDTLHNKDEELFSCRSDRDNLEREKQKLLGVIEERDRVIEEFEDRLRKFEGGQRENAENFRRQLHENEFLKEKEDRIHKELECAQERIHTLEESVEAERAAHLESKFNSEIVQLRIRDLEAALEAEKSQKIETSAVTDNLNKQIRELQQIYEDERRSNQMAQEKLHKAEKEFAVMSHQLKSDLDEKSSLIKQLSSQLDTHQANFNELKQELNKAKKRQVYLEETYTGSIKELEILLDNFEPVSSDRPNRDRKGSSAKSGPKKRDGTSSNKSQTLSSLLESLRRILIDYKRRLDDTLAEHERMKSQVESSGKELDQYKEMLWHKDKALETAQQGLARTSKDLRKYQTDYRELEAKSSDLTKEHKEARAKLQELSKENEHLKEKMVQVTAKYRTDEKTSGDFLHALYRQLLAAEKVVPLLDHPEINHIENWNDLAKLVSDQTANLVCQLQRLKEKGTHYETVLENKEQIISDLLRSYEDQLSKLTTLTDGRNEQWSQQRARLEEHYSQLLSELHARHKKTQALADQAWDKVRASTIVQQSVELQCRQLESSLGQVQQERTMLQAACALLTGTLLPLMGRARWLMEEKSVMMEHRAKMEEMRQQVKGLVEALRMEEVSSSAKSTSKRHALLHFRVGVIAVMAANRLSFLGRQIQPGTTSIDGTPVGLPRITFCPGKTGEDCNQSLKFIGVRRSQAKAPLWDADQNVGWLTNKNLTNAIMTAVADLSAIINKEESYSSEHAVGSVLRSSLQRLLTQLQSIFPVSLLDSLPTSSREKSLVGCLGRGLCIILARIENSGHQHNYLSAQSVASQLQQQVLDFTRRLHSAEIERRDLRLEVNHLKDSHQNLAERADLAEHLGTEVVELQDQVENSVAKSRFDAVCSELSNALKREEEVQMLLKEQAAQLHQMTLKMDMQGTESTKKEHSLTQTIQELNEAQLELRRHEQRTRQLARQVEALEEDKRHLQANISDAETALRTAAKDRDTLSGYIRNVQRFIESIKGQLALQLNAPSNIERVLSTDLLPAQASTKPGSELSACRGLVSSFVELHRHLEARMEVLQATVKSHQQHISTLKEELNQACRRQMLISSNQEIDDLAIAETDKANNLVSHDIQLNPQPLSSNDEEFEPLKPEENSLYTRKKLPKSRVPTMNNKTPAHKRTRSPVFRTPQASSRLSGSLRKSVK